MGSQRGTFELLNESFIGTEVSRVVCPYSGILLLNNVYRLSEFGMLSLDELIESEDEDS